MHACTTSGLTNSYPEKWFTDYLPNFIAFLEIGNTDMTRLVVLSKAVERWYGVDFELKQLNKRLAVILQSEFTDLVDIIRSLSLD